MYRLSQHFKDVYSNIGFAYITNHGIPKFLIDNIFEQSKLFHHLPEIEKLGIQQNEFFRGYMPFGGSVFNISTLGKTKSPNQSSSFILAHEVFESDDDFIKGINLAGPNQWPKENLLPEFKNVLLHYRESLTGLIRNIMRVFSLSLGFGFYDLDRYFTNPTTFLRLQYYPQQPDIIPENQYGIAPHTDYGALTLLAQDSIGGLQVMQHNGDWIDVPSLPGAFILNTGDMMRRISNNLLIATPHRVINSSGKERYSIPFFFEPSMHAFIEPLVQDNSSPEYEPIEYCKYLMNRIKNNYDIGAQ